MATWGPTPVSVNVDNAWERGDGMFVEASGLIYVYSYPDPSSEWYRCGGSRWRNVTIPQGAVIISATLTPHTYDPTYNDINTEIYGNKVANARDFLEHPHIIDTGQRPRTTNFVSWIQDGLSVGWHTLTGFKDVIQEIISQGSWVSGNALVLFYIANTDVQKKCFVSPFATLGGIHAAKLEITYEGAPIAPSSLLCEQKTNPTDVTDPEPEFSAIHHG